MARNVNKDFLNWTRDEMIRKFELEYRRINSKDEKVFNKLRRNFPNIDTIRKHFNLGWVDLRELIGEEVKIKMKKRKLDIKKLSNEELLKLFKKEYFRIQPKTKHDFDKKRINFPSYQTIMKRLGKSWSEMLREIGVEPRYRPDEEWEQLIKNELDKHDCIPPSTKMIEILGKGFIAYLRRKGHTYNSYIRELGHQPPNITQVTVLETDEELIEMYKKLSNKLGMPATDAQMRKAKDCYNPIVFMTRFGSMRNLRRLAGLPEGRPYTVKLERRDFIRILKEIINAHGEVKVTELREILREEYNTSITTFLKRFNETSARVVLEKFKRGEYEINK